MMPVRNVHIVLALLVLASQVGAQTSEVERLTGFAEHQKNNKQFDKAREGGERAYLEDLEQWENQKNRDLEAYKKEKKTVFMADDGPEAKADAQEKEQYKQQYEQTRKAYSIERAKQKELSREALGLPSEITELGLDEVRPRYPWKKRAYFGGKSQLGKSSASSGGGGPSFGGSSSSGGSFPPPPTFDDFGDSGYVPAPNMSDDFGDVPPPPPPPPPFGDEGSFGTGTEFPPPPPPPSGFDGGDF